MFLVVIGILAVIKPAQAQSFNTGVIGAAVSDYGRVRIFDGADTRQIDRSSLLVASGPTAVFDYWNDTENIDTARTIASPALSPYELYTKIDNSYNDPTLPPDVSAEIHIYGWDDANFVIVKFHILNYGATAIDARIGLEIIPQLDGSYGFETSEYLVDQDACAFYSGASTNVGYKTLSSPSASFKTIDWYDGYNSFDSDLYNWLTTNTYDTLDETTSSDGIVSFYSQPAVNLPAGADTDFFVAVAVGADKQTMQLGLTAAVDKYAQVFGTPIGDPETMESRNFSLAQNYPNPFPKGTTGNNLQTRIRFSLLQSEQVRLVVYNSLGQVVATLTNQQLPAGNHEVHFNGAGLPNGVYFYTLSSGSASTTRKMLLIR
jgi:hypothetical protein